ncbi:MAG: DUF2844 domain-containing protein [Polyangiales bacterium]
MRALTPVVERVLIVLAVFTCATIGRSHDARATLGGAASTIADNHTHLGGAHRIVKLATGERHELTLPSGMIVHQYVSSAGLVYAIAWRGPQMPDLRELLGAYFPRLSKAAALPGGGHHRVTMALDDLIVESSGHRRSFSGRAWVPSLVPSGVDPKVSIQ